MIDPQFSKKVVLIAACCILAVGLIFIRASESHTADPKTLAKKEIDLRQAFKLYSQKCLACHDSVADPEKPGRTRDSWYLAVNLMHRHGLDLTAEESEIIVDFLYHLRRGPEKDPG